LLTLPDFFVGKSLIATNLLAALALFDDFVCRYDQMPD